MKLIVAGASGFVATEVIRQSLSLSKITSVVALARSPVPVPDNLDPGANASKLQTAVVNDYGEYSNEVKKHFVGADACIWTVAITPTKSRSMDFKEVRRVCQDCTMAGLKALVEAQGGHPGNSSAPPVRFLYMSGSAAERNPKKNPGFMPVYSWMRGETENQILAFAAEHKTEVEACVAKPGLITRPGILNALVPTVLKWTGVVPNVAVSEIAAAMLDQVINGFEKEPLLNDDLVKIGQQVLSARKATKE